MSVTCIIPAYNEAARIEAVLAVVVGHPLIDDVIVVDDGSVDGTSDLVATITGVSLIALPVNRGKTAALAQAIAQASGAHLLLVDADLIGLTARDLSALIAPVLAGHADMSISLRRNAPWLWRWIGIDYISGERVLPKALIAPQLARLQSLPKFGFEVFLNSLSIAATQRIAVVNWPDVVSPLKATKYGWWTGMRADVGMLRDMLRSVPALGLVRQIIAMRRLKVTQQRLPLAGP
ncbi:MAG: glycosyltransferase [Deltaproteobacteria bacterium]